MKVLFLVSIVCVFMGRASYCISQVLPIKPTREISFVTDEGSYMNVDVSPDGLTLVFDLLGDLYSVPACGGTATQLTNGVALHLRPVWSPDGAKIAYISDVSGEFHLNVMDVRRKWHRVFGAKNAELYYGEDALWTPDSKFIDIGGTLYAISESRVSEWGPVKNLIRFSPDERFAYGLDSGRIVKYSRVTKTHAVVSCTSHPGILSPDGRWWCYILDSNGHRSLFSDDLESGATRVLVEDLNGGGSAYGASVPPQHFSFAFDSKKVFIGYAGKIHSIALENGLNTVVPFLAPVHSQLGPFDYNKFRVTYKPILVRYVRSANERLDGRQVVFSALGRIYVKDLPKGTPRILIQQSVGQFQPVYSPDGKWILYVSWSDTAGGNVWETPVAGGRPRLIAGSSGQYQCPTWSPDGKMIAVIKGAPKLGDRDDPGAGQLVTIRLDNGQVQNIADSIPLCNYLAFSGDGQRISFTPKHPRLSNNYTLFPQMISAALDGGDQRVIAIGTEITYMHQKTQSPDGRFIISSADEDLYLTPVKNPGSPVVLSNQAGKLQGVRFAAGVDPYWEKGVKKIAWTCGSRFYRISVTRVAQAVEKDSKPSRNTALQKQDFDGVAVKADDSVSLRFAAPVMYSKGLLALQDVRIITMHDNEVIEHGAILIKDGRIVAVGSESSVSIPFGTKVLTLSGTTVMPGIIDVHLHMRIPSNIFPQQSWMFLINLAYGVTTARDPSSSFDSFGYAEMIQTGQMFGPRLFTVGRAVRIPDGVFGMANFGDARRVVEKRAEMGATVVKQYLLPTRIQRQWLLMACRKARLNMTNEGAYDPILQLGMIKDGSTGIEHNPIWGDVYSDVAKFIGSSGVYFTPTLQVAFGGEMAKEYFKFKYWRNPDPKLTHFTPSDTSMHGPTRNGAEPLELIMQSVTKDSINPDFLAIAHVDTRIFLAGGRVALGSHGNDEGIGAHNELWALQMGGFSNMEALKTSTIKGAEALGIQRDLGSIEVGKIADLILLNKNPLEDIHNSKEIRYVMKDGIFYDGKTLDEIWPVQRTCPEWRMK